MKSIKFTVLPILAMFFLSCASQKEQGNSNPTDNTVKDSSLLQREETEEEETERLLRERHVEDSTTYAQLGTYDGVYLIYTESAGVDATLQLHYNGNRTFNYEWKLEVSDEGTNCLGHRKGVLTMDQTHHGFDRTEDCVIHFNFNGYWNDGYVVKVDFEDQSLCPDLVGECTFSGTYINSN